MISVLGYSALEAITRYKLTKCIEHYKQPVDKERWDEAPHVVNGFYDPQTNGIYIMGAFARGALYNSEMSDEELYAAIGVVIGHSRDKNQVINVRIRRSQNVFFEEDGAVPAYLRAFHKDVDTVQMGRVQDLFRGVSGRRDSARTDGLAGRRNMILRLATAYVCFLLQGTLFRNVSKLFPRFLKVCMSSDRHSIYVFFTTGHFVSKCFETFPTLFKKNIHVSGSAPHWPAPKMPPPRNI